MTNSQDQAPRPIVAVVPGRLAASVPSEDVLAIQRQDWWQTAQEVASDWQAVSAYADFWEFGAPAVGYGRAHELAGLLASGGEQLALSLAALAETELWRAFREANPVDDSEQGKGRGAAYEMGHRAMAELASYYLLGIGHGFANIAVRAIALDSTLHPDLLDALGTWCPPGSDDPKDWLSLNRDTARALRRVARRSERPALELLVEPTTTLLTDDDWQELNRRRGAHYHRRRPQSAGVAGVPLASPWVASGMSMSLNAFGREYADGDGLAHDTSGLSRRVLARLAVTMKTLQERVMATWQDVHDRAANSQAP